MNPLTAFLTGLSTGGLTCLAVQGGLLIGLLARRQNTERQKSLSGWQRLFLPVSAFLIAKLAVYTLFGLALGFFGEKIQLTTTMRIWLQSLAAAFMLVASARLIWPQFLPWLNINAPASIRRLIRRSAKSEAIAAPALLGALTLFIPCGSTIAMEAAAIATGNAFQAASILFAFVLGTAPLFFFVGVLAKGSAVLQRRLTYASAAFVFAIGVYTLNGVLVITDSPYSFQHQKTAWSWFLNQNTSTDTTKTVISDAHPTIEVFATGYSPSLITVPSGQPVTLNLVPKGRLGCTSIVRIPKLGIQKQLESTGATKVAVSFPQPGSYTLTCGMGMYTTTINAV